MVRDAKLWAETACFYGIGLVHKLGQPCVCLHGGSFQYEDWMQALQSGRTFITNGPSLFLSIDDSGPGDTLVRQQGEELDVTASWKSHYAVHQVEIVCPSEATAKMNALMSGRRGQILGFDTREGWEGWDIVRLQMPEAEIGDLIVEVRSATAGVGSFTFKFDHMAELSGRTADQIVAARKSAAA